MNAATAIGIAETATRQGGRDQELAFWKAFVPTERFRLNWCNASPNPELEPEIDFFVSSLAWEIEKSHRRARILDVGSGPVSILRGSFEHLNVDLVCVDPLADEYSDIRASNDLALPVSIMCGHGEQLASMFGPRSFDAVHMRNALDQTANPLSTIRQMLHVARPEGYLLVHGFERQADAQNWIGFNQWNVYHDNSDICVRGLDGIEHRILTIFESLLVPIRVYRRQLSQDRSWCGFVATVR